MAYEPIVRTHIKDVNRRLSILERKFETLSRRHERTKDMVKTLVAESLEEASASD